MTTSKQLEDLRQYKITNNDSSVYYHIPDYELKKFLATHYISKAEVLRAIGSDERSSNCPCAFDHRNQLRSDIKSQLNLKEGEE